MPTRDLVALRGLLERVLAAKGPDRGLDAETCVALDIRPGWETLPPDRRRALWTDSRAAPGQVSIGKSGPGWAAEHVTASVDTVLALAERVLPGRRLQGILEDALYRLWAEGPAPDAPIVGQIARSVLVEILTALIAQEERADGR